MFVEANETRKNCVGKKIWSGVASLVQVEEAQNVEPIIEELLMLSSCDSLKSYAYAALILFAVIFICSSSVSGSIAISSMYTMQK